MLEGTVLAIASVPFVTCASVVSVLLAGRFSKVHHSGECCQVLEGTVLAISLVPFVACASVVSVLLAGRFLRYICEPGKA